MSDPSNDGTTPPPPSAPGGYNQPSDTPPVPGGYSQPNQNPVPGGYSQPEGYGQPQGAYGQQPGGYAEQPAAYPAAGGYAQPMYGAPAPPKTLSLIGMIAGIVGVVAVGYFLPASIAALVLGYMGKKREGAPAKGFWLTAIITGWVGIALSLLVIGIILLSVVIPLFILGSSAGYSGDF